MIFPHFRRSVVRSPSLSVKKAFFGNFGHIKVSKLGSAVFVQKNVSRFHISVKYFELVKRFQTFNNLNQYLPNVFLFHVHFVSLTVTNSLENVSVISVLHHNTTVTKITYQRELLASSKNAYLYPATNGFFIDARILTSFNAFSFSRSLRFCILTFLSA